MTDDLIERLLQTDKSKHGYYGYVPYNRDGKEAAARIEQLVATCAALEAQVAALSRVVEAAQPFSAMAGAMFAQNWNSDDVGMSIPISDDEWARLTFADFLTLRRALTLSSTPVTASPAPDPAPALGAEWMRRNAVEWLADYPRISPSALEAEHYDDQISHSIDCVNNIPGPTPADLLAEAARVPEVAALVKAATKAMTVLEIYEDEEMAGELRAALAALPCCKQPKKGGA